MLRRSFLKLCAAAIVTTVAPLTVVAEEKAVLEHDLLIEYFRRKVEGMLVDWDARLDDVLLAESEY